MADQCFWNYKCNASTNVCRFHCVIPCSDEDCFVKCAAWSSWTLCEQATFSTRDRVCKCENIVPQTLSEIQLNDICKQQTTCIANGEESNSTLTSKEAIIVSVGMGCFIVLMISCIFIYLCKRHRKFLQNCSTVDISCSRTSLSPPPNRRILPEHILTRVPSEYVQSKGPGYASLPAYGDRSTSIPPPYMIMPNRIVSRCCNDEDTNIPSPPAYNSDTNTHRSTFEAVDNTVNAKSLEQFRDERF